MINIYKFHQCPSLLATPGFELTTFRFQSGDTNHSAIPPLTCSQTDRQNEQTNYWQTDKQHDRITPPWLQTSKRTNTDDRKQYLITKQTNKRMNKQTNERTNTGDRKQYLITNKRTNKRTNTGYRKQYLITKQTNERTNKQTKMTENSTWLQTSKRTNTQTNKRTNTGDRKQYLITNKRTN